MPTTTIFLRSYKPDFPWLSYALKSIQKYASGFSETVIVIPDTDSLDHLTAERVVKEKETMTGYLNQQVCKLYADMHTDAEFILVTDSDTLFIEPVTPESFMRDGKPIWYMTPFSEEVLEHAGMRAWFAVLKKFFGEDPSHEMMRRQPFMFPREVLKGLRDFCQDKFGKPIEQYVMDEGEFSEWNILGYYCWLHHRESFYWLDTSIELPPAKARQFYSWGGFNPEIRKELEAITA